MRICPRPSVQRDRSRPDLRAYAYHDEDYLKRKTAGVSSALTSE